MSIQDENIDITEKKAYLVDLNGDGIDDLIYQIYWHPEIAIYYNGKFVFCDIDSQAYGGAYFPSGEGSGYFLMQQKALLLFAMKDKISAQ